MTPPDLLDRTSPNLRANGESASQVNKRTLMRDAAAIGAELGIEFSPAALRAIAGRFLADGGDLTLRSWILSYRDPVGEEAVRNVMRGG